RRRVGPGLAVVVGVGEHDDAVVAADRAGAEAEGEEDAAGVEASEAADVALADGRRPEQRPGLGDRNRTVGNESRIRCAHDLAPSRRIGWWLAAARPTGAAAPPGDRRPGSPPNES